jgi:hypothetical protein
VSRCDRETVPNRNARKSNACRSPSEQLMDRPTETEKDRERERDRTASLDSRTITRPENVPTNSVFRSSTAMHVMPLGSVRKNSKICVDGRDVGETEHESDPRPCAESIETVCGFVPDTLCRCPDQAGARRRHRNRPVPFAPPSDEQARATARQRGQMRGDGSLNSQHCKIHRGWSLSLLSPVSYLLSNAQH